jgi:alpha-D-ribose 1-methylphosphonate 5-triphosphate synthase subunit PhnG
MVDPFAHRSPEANPPDYPSSRQALMRLLSRSNLAELQEGLAALGDLPRFEPMRRTETGLVMVRGRMGGEGAQFNFGEATVSRAATRLESGETGFSYILGREVAKADLCALIDALYQREDFKGPIEERMIGPLTQRRRAEASSSAGRTAATKVEFFTMVRGEDK